MPIIVTIRSCSEVNHTGDGWAHPSFIFSILPLQSLENTMFSLKYTRSPLQIKFCFLNLMLCADFTRLLKNFMIKFYD